MRSPDSGRRVRQRRPAHHPVRPPRITPRAAADTASSDQVNRPGGEREANHDEPEADLKAFFEAADISVTEVKNPPGGSLPF